MRPPCQYAGNVTYIAVREKHRTISGVPTARASGGQRAGQPAFLTQAFAGRFGAMMGEADRDFGRCRVVMIQEGGKR
jgi:hypothetical protein